MKATYKGKKEVKNFTLRNVDPTLMTSSSDLKDLIKTNFHDDVKCGDFDVGYMVGTEVIRVWTEEDLKEMWGEIRKNWCTTLLCDGLVDDESSKSNKSSKPGRKRQTTKLLLLNGRTFVQSLHDLVSQDTNMHGHIHALHNSINIKICDRIWENPP